MIYKNLQKTRQPKLVDTITQNYNDLKAIAEQEIEVENIYEKYFKIEKGDVVLDVGAHIGIFTKKAIPLAKTIYAIEPDPLFLKDLKNLKAKNLVVSAKAIAEKEGKSLISSDGLPNAIGTGDTEIETISFTQYIKDFKIKKIDFLKTDCEGGEYDIFIKENMPWIKKNVKKMTGELHIHSSKHRMAVLTMFNLFDEYGIKYLITSVDGVVITLEHLEKNLHYYKEILFYALSEGNFDIPLVYNINYVNGCYVEINDGVGEYDVVFINNSTNEVLHKSKLGVRQWARCYYQYFVDWRILISQDDIIIEDIALNLNKQRVYVAFESKGLGDTLAWFPMVEEFRKKHDCELICTTFLNDLFRDTYPSIKFIEPSEVAHNIIAQYNIGWFYDGDEINRHKNPSDPKLSTLQKTASDILGLDYIKEIKPILSLPKVTKSKTVAIAMHSTTQAKYWNNPTGWQDVVDYLNDKKYVSLLVSREADGHMGNKQPINAKKLPSHDLNTMIKMLCQSELFIGIGSGLSWLAWACNVPVILISGFSDPYTEMEDCIRIGTDEGICKGCFNTFKLDMGDWGWCPMHKGTDREFECTKTITSQEVISVIEEILAV